MEIKINGWKMPAITAVMALVMSICGGLVSAIVWQTRADMQILQLSQSLAEEKLQRRSLEATVSEINRTVSRIDGQFSLFLSRELASGRTNAPEPTLR